MLNVGGPVRIRVSAAPLIPPPLTPTERSQPSPPLVQVSSIAISIQHQQQLGRSADRSQGVRNHGRERRGFTGFHSLMSILEDQLHRSGQHEEPFVSGVHAQGIGVIDGRGMRESEPDDRGLRTALLAVE